MKAVLFDFKTAKEEWFESASAVYLKKIKPFLDFEIVHLKTLKEAREDLEKKKAFEEKELFSKLSKDDFIILFDEKGKDLDSIVFSKELTKAMSSGKKRLVFVIGGAFGVTDAVKDKAHLKISLSKMVMNHLVAETVVLEQIYRAMTIQNRIPYHNI